MRIQSVKNIIFNGYGAQKINALFMQNAQESQRFVFDELRHIGKKEDFDVFLHSKDALFFDVKEIEKKQKDGIIG